jgi:hypothetical protein
MTDLLGTPSMDTISRVRSYNLCELLFCSMCQMGSTFAEFVLSPSAGSE